MKCFQFGITRATVLFLAIVAIALPAAGQVSVWTQHNDNSRTGQNLQETTLTTSNVSVSTFGKLFSLPVDSNIYAQPLYIPNLTIQGQTRNALYVATANDTVYAFDADSGDTSPLWIRDDLGTPVPSQDICSTNPGECPYTDVVPVIGIVSTPVIDTQSGTIYVVPKTKDSSGNYHFWLRAFDLLTGEDKFVPNGVEITASGFTPFTQIQRPGLTLANGMVYLGFGSEGDFPSWHGWVMAYDAATLQQVGIFNSTSQNNSVGGAGIWMTGNGLVTDNNGDIYCITSNGNFDLPGGKDYGSAYLRLSGTASAGTNTLAVLDYFTPYNQAQLNPEEDNVDLGSGGAMLIPTTTYLVGGGKDAVMRVVDTTNMGQYNGISNTNHQNISAVTPVQIFGSPVYWNSPNLGPLIYLWGSQDFAKAWGYNATTTLIGTAPVMESTIQGVTNTFYDHAALSISANGNTGGTGILWGSTPYSGDSNGATGTPAPGALYAFDATDLTKELWDSQMDSTRDAPGFWSKFVPPTVVNGKVYLATFSNSGTSIQPASVAVYGLLPLADFGLSAGPQSQTIQAGNSAAYVVYASPQNGYTGSVALSCQAPQGLTCSFNPATLTLTQGSGQVSSQLTISTTSSTTATTYSITITGTDGTTNHTTTVGLVVGGGSGSGNLISATALTPATITAGSSATSTVTAGGSSAVNLTCAVTPAGANSPACSLNPASIMGGSGSSTLTVTTVARSASLGKPNQRQNLIFYAMLFPVAGFTLLGAGCGSRKRKALLALLLCVAISGLVFLVACGGGSSNGGGGGGGGGGTNAGTYTVTVTGTAGTQTQTQTLTLTVQ